MIETNIITIDGGAYLDIKKALRQWIDLYSKSFEPDFEFELYKSGKAKHIIRADKRLDNESFIYLVNYLTYPEGINYQATVKGFTTIKDTKLFSEEKLNNEVIIYIPKDEKDYDNVYGITSDNEVVKIDFGGKTTKIDIEKKFDLPNIDLLNLGLPEKLKVARKRLNLTELTETDNIRLGKRIKKIQLVILSLLLLSFLSINQTTYFLIINYAISFGTCFWFFFDYKLLQNNSRYLKLLFLSLLISVYGYFLQIVIGIVNIDTDLLRFGTLSPIGFLLTQRIYRFIFKHFMKREPIVEKPAPSFQDGIYMLLLVFSFILFTILLVKYAP